MQARAATAYKKVFLESAPPTRVLDELYGRLLLDIETAKEGIAKRDLKKKGEAVSHGMAILDELAVALNHDVAPELSANLARLYEFCGLRMGEANARLEVAPLEEVHRIVSDLRESFRQVAGLSR